MSKNWLYFASNRQHRSTSAINRAFSPATPIHHTYQCHVLVPMRMLNIKTGSGRRAIKSLLVYCTTSYKARGHTATTTAMSPWRVARRGVCALESSCRCCVLLHRSMKRTEIHLWLTFLTSYHKAYQKRHLNDHYNALLVPVAINNHK